MFRRTWLWSTCISALSLVAAAAFAQTISVLELQRLLEHAPRNEVRFQETRESPWLPAATESTGRMRSSASMLEKEIETPRRETWRLLDDRMQVVTAGSTVPKDVMYKDQPAVAQLANALRNVMSGKLSALEQDFKLVSSGTEQAWTLRLVPKEPGVTRFLKELEIQGVGPLVRVIIILETQGDRTTTHLID